MQSLPEKRPHPVLIMHHGNAESFNDMIDSLPALPPLEFGGKPPKFAGKRYSEYLAYTFQWFMFI